MIYFEEALYPHWAQTFKILRVIYHEHTSIQEVAVFETDTFGRILALDGVIQTTEADEYHYHEMIVHVPLLAHGSVQSVCIIGGGDGGALRETLKYPGVCVTLVEIDAAVVETSRRYLPAISAGSLESHRVSIVISDGTKYMAEAGVLFDVIIVDSTDPKGPGSALFEESFYSNCRQRLKPNGILAVQSGVPFLQPGEVYNTYRRLRPYFADVWFFVTAVPTYVGGFMTLGWGSLNPAYRTQPLKSIQARCTAIGLETRYYTPEVHIASFALPRYVERLLL